MESCERALPRPDIREGDTIVRHHILTELQPGMILGIVIKDWSEYTDEYTVDNRNFSFIEIYDAEHTTRVGIDSGYGPVRKLTMIDFIVMKNFTIIRNGRYLRYTVTQTKKNGIRMIVK